MSSAGPLSEVLTSHSRGTSIARATSNSKISWAAALSRERRGPERGRLMAGGAEGNQMTQAGGRAAGRAGERVFGRLA